MDNWDHLHICKVCGDRYVLGGYVCRICAEQRAIDDVVPPSYSTITRKKRNHVKKRPSAPTDLSE